MDSVEKSKLLSRWAKREKALGRDAESEIAPFIGSANAVFLYGPRRSGKSTVAKRLAWSLEGKGARIRVVNLEDPALEGLLSTRLLDEFAQGFGQKDLLVLDEVQAIDGWEKWVRRAADTRQCMLVVTGSSARLLSSEFATTLGGRGIGFQVLPLSYSEFARFSSQSLEKFLETGGYPEVVLNPKKAEKLLETYFELVLIKDVAARYKIRNTSDLRALALFLLTNSGKLTSLKQIRASLGLSFDSARTFIEGLEAAYLVFQVPFFSYSLKDSLARQRKIYAWDNGMQAYSSKSFSPDLGRKAEAAVAVELKRRGFELYYWREASEVDFVARKKLELTALNVSYSKKPAEREEKGLLEFCAKHKAKNAALLYLGPDKTIEKQGVTIQFKNLEKWLLEKQKIKTKQK